MSQYHVSYSHSNMLQVLIVSGYLGCILLAAASIYIDTWLFVSACMLFYFSYAAEHRPKRRITVCDENAEALNHAGEAIRLCPPMIITPWMITVQVKITEPLMNRTAPKTWYRIWRDQLTMADWARIRRIGITLNAPLRRR